MPGAPASNTLIIGLSGPSSSGKTTLARLLRQIFNLDHSNTSGQKPIKFFILHEDDFYKTDKLIPRKIFTSQEHGTRELDDWDCVEALDLPLLRRVMIHVQNHGELLVDFASKEDRNTVGESGIPDSMTQNLKEELRGWLEKLPKSSGQSAPLTICLLDGFLLYPDPNSAEESLERQLHDILKSLLSLKLFISSTRDKTIERRTKRSGYVTLEGFWADPPGYVEDVVWSNYRRDHAWLFRPVDEEGDEKGLATRQANDIVDQGQVNRDTAAQAGILVGPGDGEAHLREILPWAVDRLKEAIEREILGR